MVRIIDYFGMVKSGIILEINSNYDDLFEYKIKSSYVNGVLDRRLYGYLKIWSKNATLANESFGESVDYLSVREVITSLNHFYEDPLNSYL
ncbi:MAG: hypothetical protein CMG41_01585 [Candidatus Marinimicrobia bacterium]|nr:hypothetical protein [Candidatus Neomarinimicrobiota bacterium]|tara:strand:+ start:398 stop:670 length:273 start_codon:yes stop_codon:yes gene_type:complete